MRIVQFLSKYRYAFSMVIFGLLIVFVDFATKIYVYNLFGGGCLFSIPVFQNFLGIDFSIVLTFNSGAAWGMFSNFQFILLLFRMAVVIGLIVYLLRFNKYKHAILPFVMIIAGAIGNITDFFLYRFVVDFLQLNLWGYDFPAFNVADSCITIGVIWLLLLSLLARGKSLKCY